MESTKKESQEQNKETERTKQKGIKFVFESRRAYADYTILDNNTNIIINSTYCFVNSLSFSFLFLPLISCWKFKCFCFCDNSYNL